MTARLSGRLALCLCAMTALVLPRPGLAQRKVQKLTPKTKQAGTTFSDLLAGQATQALGQFNRLPSFEGDPVLPSVYVMVTPRGVWVWDTQEVAFSPPGQLQPADVVNCPPACLPKLRDAVAAAVLLEANRLTKAGRPPLPTVSFVVDPAVPVRSFLAVAYSVAYASAGAPPALRLVGRNAANQVVVAPFFLIPARPLKMAANANPLLVSLRVEGPSYTISARRHWLPSPETTTSPKEVMKILGELKARDPIKTILFLRVAPDAAFDRFMQVFAKVRELYPDITLGGLPRVVGPVED